MTTPPPSPWDSPRSRKRWFARHWPDLDQAGRLLVQRVCLWGPLDLSRLTGEELGRFKRAFLEARQSEYGMTGLRQSVQAAARAIERREQQEATTCQQK